MINEDDELNVALGEATLTVDLDPILRLIPASVQVSKVGGADLNVSLVETSPNQLIVPIGDLEDASLLLVRFSALVRDHDEAKTILVRRKHNNKKGEISPPPQKENIFIS